MKAVRIAEETEKEINFVELLLDETICAEVILVPEEMVRLAGGQNKMLQAKQKYELLLRIVHENTVIFDEIAENDSTSKLDGHCGYIRLDSEQKDVTEQFGWRTDCYLIGKYSVELQDGGYFQLAVQSILQEGIQKGRKDETIAFLEQMISHSSIYYKIDDQTRPIMIYKGDDACQNLLTVFAERLGESLIKKGEHVVYFDFSKEPVGEIVQFVDKRYKAIIGIQSYLFTIKFLDEIHYVHEYIDGPKFNFIFDHPIWMHAHLSHTIPDYYVLTHDMDYVEFVKKYFQKEAYQLLPGGMLNDIKKEEKDRIYDITFVGYCGDYYGQVLEIHGKERNQRFLANRFLLIMKKNPDLTVSEAFQKTLDYYHLTVTEQEFLDLLHENRKVIYCVMRYYRQKVIEEILRSGIRVDVFGNDWKTSRLQKYENLVCHPNITPEESVEVWQRSKVSLNIMSWHKSGFTERMAGIMLAGAVLVTDYTTYLDGRYDAEDMLIFHLDNFENLGERMKDLLENDDKRNQIAWSGKKKALNYHTWDKSAENFLAILQKINGD